MKKFIYALSGFLGIFLLLVNIWGLSQGKNVWPKPPRVYKSANHTPFSRATFDPERKEGENDLAYAERMNLFVHSRTIHHFYDENSLDNIAEIVAPFSWSWPLWLRGLVASIVGPKFTVEFCDPVKGLERGYGYCSQRALILQNILRENGIDAWAVDLDDHVVCVATINGREMTFDPDYGFSSRMSLEEIHNKPEALLEFISEDAYRNHLEPVYRAARWRERGRKEYYCRSDFNLFVWRCVQWGVPVLMIAFCLRGMRGQREKVEKPA